MSHETSTHILADQLRVFTADKKPYRFGVTPSQIGCEFYQLIFTGNQAAVLFEAAERLEGQSLQIHALKLEMEMLRERAAAAVESEQAAREINNRLMGQLKNESTRQPV